MNLVEEYESILHNNGTNITLQMLINKLQSFINRNVYTAENVTDYLIDVEFLAEIKRIITDDISIYFGKTLRDIKCVILDEGLREHTVFIKYTGPKKLVVTTASVSYTSLQDIEYNSLVELITAYRNHVNSLSGYFYELERIDRMCTVMEPAEPTFKDDFRRILLDDRIWLHLEVTPDGLATNIHLIGQSELWNNKLQQGLLTWDHDKDIVENVMTVFDLETFPVVSSKSTVSEDKLIAEETLCGICLCVELPDNTGVPLPLCQNPLCGVYFHRNCLFQWLVACGGGRPPPFGVATGTCPACLDSITCGERDT